MAIDDLKKLRDGLPRKWREKLSEITGKSSATVEGVLFGRFNNTEILDAAIAMAHDEKKNAEKRKELLNQL